MNRQIILIRKRNHYYMTTINSIGLEKLIKNNDIKEMIDKFTRLGYGNPTPTCYEFCVTHYMKSVEEMCTFQNEMSNSEADRSVLSKLRTKKLQWSCTSILCDTIINHPLHKKHLKSKQILPIHIQLTEIN